MRIAIAFLLISATALATYSIYLDRTSSNTNQVKTTIEPIWNNTWKRHTSDNFKISFFYPTKFHVIEDDTSISITSSTVLDLDGSSPEIIRITSSLEGNLMGFYDIVPDEKNPKDMLPLKNNGKTSAFTKYTVGEGSIYGGGGLASYVVQLKTSLYASIVEKSSFMMRVCEDGVCTGEDKSFNTPKGDLELARTVLQSITFEE